MAALPSVISQTVEKLAALKISIISPETEVKAREYLASLRKAVKDLKASVTELKKPYKQEIDEIDKLSKPLLEMLAKRDQETEQAILAYVRKVREEAEKRNQKELEKYEKKVATVEAKAIANNKPMPIVIPPAMVTAPPKTVELEGARQTIVKRKAWRIRINGAEVTDPASLTALACANAGSPVPLDYFTLDTSRIGKVVRAGGTIPGIEVYEEESLSQRAI